MDQIDINCSHFVQEQVVMGNLPFLKLLTKLFGKSLYTLPINMFTSEPKSAESASPNLVNLKGKLFGVIADMASKSKLYTGMIKTISGNDQIVARKLHGSPVEFTPRCNLLFMVNDLPDKIDDTSDGFLRKALVIPFTQKFVKEEDRDPNKPWLQVADDNVEKTLLENSEEFALLLIQRYSVYRKSGYKIPKQPEIVKEATRKYKEVANPAEKFFKDHIVVQDLTTSPLDIRYLCYDDIKEFVEKLGLTRKAIRAVFDKNTNFPGNSDRKWRYPKGHEQATPESQFIAGWKGLYFVAEKPNIEALE